MDNPDGGWSDHPGGDHQGGPDWVADIVHAIGKSWQISGNHCDYWGDHTDDATAILVTWDDWGGFYDHIVPWKLVKGGGWGAGYTWGFRVPLLVVSPWTGTDTQGYISGKCQSVGVCNNDAAPYQHDFGSILNFTEYVFGLPPGGIGLSQNLRYDDYWAPDYYGNGSCNNNKQLCPYGLSDFFGGFQHKRSFKDITPVTYQPGDFSNQQKFPNWPEPADLETP